MKTKILFYFSLIFVLANQIIAQNNNNESVVKNNTDNGTTNAKEVIEDEKFEPVIKKEIPSRKKNIFEKTILFNSDNEDLSNAINRLAALKCYNIIFPQPPAKLTTKLTFFANNPLPLDDAWNLIAKTVLSKSGYSLIKKGNTYEIKSNLIATREPLPIYVNSIDKIPNTDEKIRFLYFFENINIQNPSNPSFTNLDQILRDMLVNEPEPTYILDANSNSLLISNNANSIKGVMKIIGELDKVGFREAIEVVDLQHAKADFIVSLINKLMPPAEDQYRFGFPKITKSGTIFSENTKVISLERGNKVAILGSPESVKRIREFIQKNLDQPIDSGRSIIHVKPLEYLDATELAPVLDGLVKAKAPTSQAEAESKDTLSHAVIVAEQQVTAATISPSAPGTTTPAKIEQPSQGPIMGGNNLVVAARQNDWHMIDKIVDEIDKPHLQVALEVLITEVEITKSKILGAQTRNIADPGNPNNLKFQTAHLVNTPPAPWVNYINQPQGIINSERGIASDLLLPQLRANALGQLVPSNIASLATSGSTIIDFENGNGISHVVQVLNNYTGATILSQPYLVTKNHKQATVSTAVTRYVPGSVKEQSTGGPLIIANELIKADLTIDILPRVSELGDINLDIEIRANNFDSRSASGTERQTRRVKTNANVNNKSVLVLGGLIRNDDRENNRETPILSKIPIIGFLFKRRQSERAKVALMVFISPTIIRPKLEGGLNSYSSNKINYLKNSVQLNEEFAIGVNLENLRDPITRFFFPPITPSTNRAIEYYAEQGVFGMDPGGQILPVEPLTQSKNSPILTKDRNLQKLIQNDENPITRK